MGTGYLDTTNQRYPKQGDRVLVVQKKDYGPGTLTEGTVQDVLTKKQTHPRGHKVRLTSGVIGRVQKFVDEQEQIDKQTPEASIITQQDDPDFDLR